MKTQTQNQPMTDQACKILIERLGEEHRSRIEAGVNRCGSFWTEADGDQSAFEDFCRHFRELYVVRMADHRWLRATVRSRWQDATGFGFGFGLRR